MKKMISLFILLFSVAATAQVKTYHIDIKNWPDRRSIETQINELVDSKACYDINGKTQSPEVDCHKFTRFTKNSDLKPFKKDPTDIKMVIAYAGGEMKVMMFKWDGKKTQRILNSGSKFNAQDIKGEVIKWTFK